MYGAILPAAFVSAAACAVAIRVVARRDKSEEQWLLFGLAVSLAFWGGGIGLRWLATSEAGQVSSLRVVFLGIIGVPPLWLLVAARHTRMWPWLQPALARAILIAPSLLAYIALLTNQSHHGVVVATPRPGSNFHSWAGPLLWAFALWGGACVVAGSAIYAASVRPVWAGGERGRAILLGAASVAPVVAITVKLCFGRPVLITPLSLTVTLLILSATILRNRIAESDPLARRDVIEHLSDGVIVANADGLVLDSNPAALKLLGRDTEGLRQHLLADVLSSLSVDEEREGLRSRLDDLDAQGGSLDVEVCSPDGRRFDVHAACVRCGKGETTGQFAVLRDRTEDRRYEEVVRRTQKLETVGTLAAGIAHEVNNPLAFVRANLGEVRRMGARVDEALRGCHGSLAESLSGLPGIAAEALERIGRIEAAVTDMRRMSVAPSEGLVPLDLNQVVHDACRLSRLRGDARAELETKLADALPPVRGSSQLLVQALLNLLVNAEQALAGRANGQVVVETVQSDSGVEILVSDNGPGIPEEVAQRAFDPFFTTRGPEFGLGLGLSIVADIVRDHGGEVALRSQPGEGTVVCIELPASVGEEDTAA